MHPRTPFRIPPRRSSSSAGPNTRTQFASTPRFVLSQSTPGSTKGKDDDPIDAEFPQQTPIATTARPTSQKNRQPGSAPRRKELIEDDTYHSGAEPNNLSKDNILDWNIDNSCPTEGEGELDAEFEALFGAATDRTKRRRISLNRETPFTQHGRSNTDFILTSSPEAGSPTAELPTSPIPCHTPKQTAQEAVYHRTVSAPLGTPRPSTPRSVKPPFRNHPRFMLSGTQPASSSQSQPDSRTLLALETQSPASPPQRRKPTFVLPRSPSPSKAGDDAATIPTPFSPSSHTLRRRGRPRSNAPAYVPGGMAADVRGWVLEMGTNHEQLEAIPSHRRSTISPSRGTFPGLEEYFIAIRISNVRQSALSSSGPLAFVEGSPVSSLVGQEDLNSEPTFQLRKILLFGGPQNKSATLPSPRSSIPIPELRPGHLIGVHRGLVWEMELSNLIREMHMLESGYESHPADGEKWVVGMEWDLMV